MVRLTQSSRFAFYIVMGLVCLARPARGDDAVEQLIKALKRLSSTMCDSDGAKQFLGSACAKSDSIGYGGATGKPDSYPAKPVSDVKIEKSFLRVTDEVKDAAGNVTPAKGVEFSRHPGHLEISCKEYNCLIGKDKSKCLKDLNPSAGYANIYSSAQNDQAIQVQQRNFKADLYEYLFIRKNRSDGASDAEGKDEAQNVRQYFTYPKTSGHSVEEAVKDAIGTAPNSDHEATKLQFARTVAEFVNKGSSIGACDELKKDEEIEDLERGDGRQIFDLFAEATERGNQIAAYIPNYCSVVGGIGRANEEEEKKKQKKTNIQDQVVEIDSLASSTSTYPSNLSSILVKILDFLNPDANELKQWMTWESTSSSDGLGKINSDLVAMVKKLTDAINSKECNGSISRRENPELDQGDQGGKNKKPSELSRSAQDRIDKLERDNRDLEDKLNKAYNGGGGGSGGLGGMGAMLPLAMMGAMPLMSGMMGGSGKDKDDDDKKSSTMDGIMKLMLMGQMMNDNRRADAMAAKQQLDEYMRSCVMIGGKFVDPNPIASGDEHCEPDPSRLKPNCDKKSVKYMDQYYEIRCPRGYRKRYFPYYLGAQPYPWDVPYAQGAVPPSDNSGYASTAITMPMPGEDYGMNSDIPGYAVMTPEYECWDERPRGRYATCVEIPKEPVEPVVQEANVVTVPDNACTNQQNCGNGQQGGGSLPTATPRFNNTDQCLNCVAVWNAGNFPNTQCPTSCYVGDATTNCTVQGEIQIPNADGTVGSPTCQANNTNTNTQTGTATGTGTVNTNLGGGTGGTTSGLGTGASSRAELGSTKTQKTTGKVAPSLSPGASQKRAPRIPSSEGK